MATKLGAVIVFKQGITKEQAEKWLRQVSDRDTGIIENSEFNTVHEFNADIGGPVWYIP